MAPITRAAAARAAATGRSAAAIVGPTNASSTTPSPRVLVVFDFDESLVEEDSDVFFLQSLDPELLAQMLASMQTGVPDEGHSALEDKALGYFHARKPDVTREQMRETIARVPVSPQMLAAVKLAVDQYDATVVIASDANDFFIRSMLEHNDMTEYVAQIHANKASWEGGASSSRLRVKPYHAASRKPHGCALCPRNLCKGTIMDALRKKTAYDLVLYVGDGRGDYCPCTRLTSRDVVFARADSAEGRSFGLLQKINDAPEKVNASVIPWRTGDEIYEHFEETLKAATVA